MARTMQLTAIIEREGAEYVSICPELDIASQGATTQKARGCVRTPRAAGQGHRAAMDVLESKHMSAVRIALRKLNTPEPLIADIAQS